MPYRVRGNCVEVKRESGWETVKCHEKKQDALTHLAALVINVEEAKSIAVEGEVAKLDEDQHLVFGWAYVVEKDGVPVVDHSGDVVGLAALEDLEAAVYGYVLDSREADDMHRQLDGVGKLVECMVLTPAKAEAMGISTDRYGAWVGFKIEDADVWAKIKAGERRMFSIRGAGTREELVA